MLPLLPALILLLLQGPAGIERMARNGQLPLAMEALHRQVGVTEKSRPADEVVFASLLAVSGSQDMSRAFIRLLTLGDELTAPEAPVNDLTLDCSAPAPIPSTLGSPSQGFFACRRTRDGPLPIA